MTENSSGRVSPEYLDHHQWVTEAFGYWPAFHDSEVISFTLDRSQVLFTNIHNARIEMTIRALEWTRPVNGEKPRFNHHLVRFAFEEVSEVKLADFNHQNVLFDLTFVELPLDGAGLSSFEVSLNGVFGLDASFSARRGSVVSVEPCDGQEAL